MPPPQKDVSTVMQQLLSYYQAGLLVSEEELRNNIVEIIEQGDNPPLTSNTITTIGIPTRGRPDILARAVASFMENSQHYERQTDFVIIDDSREHADIEKNKIALREIRSQLGGSIYYANRQDRLEYAKALSNHSKVPLEVLEFALLGDDRCNFTPGASRNALMLHSTGELCLQVDDDTICKIAPSPEIKRGYALSSAAIPNDFWFFRTRNAAFEAITTVEKDFLDLHEKLLGKDLNSLISDNIRDGAKNCEELFIDKMSPTFLKNMNTSAAKVAVTHLGSVGDSGFQPNSNAFRLFLKNGSYDRLINSEQDYRVGINTREVLRVAPCNTISDGTLFINMNIGLDNRSLFPPYMPVQRREDGILGRTLRICFPSSYSGYLPYAIYHDPPESRAEDPGNIFDSLKSFRTNDLLDLLICSFSTWPLGLDSDKNISMLGYFLTNLGSLPLADFKDFIRSAWSARTRISIQSAEYYLNENSGAPEYWVKDMQRYISTSLKALTQNNILIPCDLPGSIDERQSLFKELVHKFGELLVNWPDIVDAAKELRSKGYLLASKV